MIDTGIGVYTGKLSNLSLVLLIPASGGYTFVDEDKPYPLKLLRYADSENVTMVAPKELLQW